MAGNGPPPNPNAKRSNVRVGVLKLPAEGRTGRAPAWPLPGKATTAERKAWTELWSTPQAVAWEELGWTRTVGRYCRILVESELPNARADVRGEARQLEDRLGLTPKAMRLLMWQIVEDEVGERRGGKSAAKQSSRRLRAVDSGG